MGLAPVCPRGVRRQAVPDDGQTVSCPATPSDPPGSTPEGLGFPSRSLRPAEAPPTAGRTHRTVPAELPRQAGPAPPSWVCLCRGPSVSCRPPTLPLPVPRLLPVTHALAPGGGLLAQPPRWDRGAAGAPGCPGLSVCVCAPQSASCAHPFPAPRGCSRGSQPASHPASKMKTVSGAGGKQGGGSKPGWIFPHFL